MSVGHITIIITLTYKSINIIGALWNDWKQIIIFWKQTQETCSKIHIFVPNGNQITNN